MANCSRARRASGTSLAGRRRARELAVRLGTALREGRLKAGATQAVIAERARVSQPYVSGLERGRGSTASVEVWASLAEAVGLQLAAFLEMTSGATRPRDYEHLKRQQLIIATAAEGGWQAKPELAVDQGWTNSRAVDVCLERAASAEVIVVEVWDFFDDVGVAIRGLDGKLVAVTRRYAAVRGRAEVHDTPGTSDGATGPGATDWGGWRVRGLFVVRGTRRNRALVREFGGIFRARFEGSSEAVIASLGDPARPFPPEDALVWTDVAGARLIPARLGR
jgi:transcriptional regulator with XRE-family HTH domain